jgi:hypothetical protein
MTGKICKLDKISDDEEYFEANDHRPLIPEGTYDVCCIKIGEGVSHYNSLKLFLTFRIISQGQYEGIELAMYINVTYSKTGKRYKQVPRGSKYFQQWVIANNNNLPARHDKMSRIKFKNAVFEAVIKTVKPKFPDGTEQPECFHYSKVSYLKRRLA